MKRYCTSGYDPYDSASSRVWIYGIEGREFQWDDFNHFFDPERPKYRNHVDYVRQVSTRPANPADWKALAPVANMNDPFDSLKH